MQPLGFSGNTHPGRRRRENQDACIVRPLWSDNQALLAVIDGVGGYAGGEKAAAIARECIEQYMQMPRGNTLTMLREAVLVANNHILEERKKDEQVSEMCCVLTAAVADAGAGVVYFVHIGDTRLYRYRKGMLQKLTSDHSVVGIKEDAGELTEQEAMAHPHRNQILREVGSAPHRLDDAGFMDYGREEFLPGDVLLLCSDGLTDMITAAQVSAVLASGSSLEEKVNALIARANEMGGHDNITVVLVQRDGNDQPVQDQPQPPETEGNTDPAPAATTGARRKIRPGRKRGLALIGLLAVAAAGWYFSPAGNNSFTRGSYNTPAQLAGVISENNRSLPSVRSTHPAIHGPAAMRADTLRIRTTQNLEDLVRYADSTGRSLVLVPDDKSKRFAAVAVTARSAKPGDTLLIRNLRLLDFETGIDVHVPVMLKTENLVFENILYPFNYLYKNDHDISSALFMNTVKH